MWKLLDKRYYEPKMLDFDLKEINGTHSCQTRGGPHKVEIESINNTITIGSNKVWKFDKLHTHMSNRTWLEGNSILIIKDGILNTDQVYGHYILKKR